MLPLGPARGPGVTVAGAHQLPVVPGGEALRSGCPTVRTFAACGQIRASADGVRRRSHEQDKSGKTHSSAALLSRSFTTGSGIPDALSDEVRQVLGDHRLKSLRARLVGPEAPSDRLNGEPGTLWTSGEPDAGRAQGVHEASRHHGEESNFVALAAPDR
jgi:hypothetical protein